MNAQAGSAFFESLFYGIFIGICLIAIIALAQFGRYWYLLKRKYHKAIFDVFLQASSEEANYNVTCEVKYHSILFTAKNAKNETLFHGEFIMNPLNLKFGEGYFHRVKNHDDPANHEAYGFMKVIIKNDWTFLVEEQTPATNQSGNSHSLAHPAIVWKRI